MKWGLAAVMASTTTVARFYFLGSSIHIVLFSICVMRCY
jgi:hypothetical protein